MTDYTDYIDQHVCCYTVPAMSQPPRERQRQPGRIHRVVGRQAISPEGQTITAIGAPYEGWCLVLDRDNDRHGASGAVWILCAPRDKP